MGLQATPRLLMVVHSAKPAGAQLLALGHAEALASDHELVIAIRHGPLRARFARVGSLIRGPTVLPIWGASRRRWALQLARAIPDSIRLAMVARQRRISVIVANSTVLVAPVLAARLARLPVLVFAQEAPTSRAAHRLFRFHGALADTVIAASSWIAEGFGSCRSRVVVIPHGILIPPWADRPRRHPSARVRLLVAGTIDSHKHQHVAVSALAKLREAGVDAELEIVGREADKTYAGKLHQLVRSLGLSERVSFIGESPDVAGHMRTDVVLVPAGEVTPLVLMEAMAVGTPVVAARMGGIPDVVLEGESGLLVEPGNGGAMAAAVRRLLEEPGLAGRLARAGRDRVETHFDERRGNEVLRAELKRLAGTR